MPAGRILALPLFHPIKATDFGRHQHSAFDGHREKSWGVIPVVGVVKRSGAKPYSGKKRLGICEYDRFSGCRKWNVGCPAGGVCTANGTCKVKGNTTGFRLSQGF